MCGVWFVQVAEARQAGEERVTSATRERSSGVKRSSQSTAAAKQTTASSSKVRQEARKQRKLPAVADVKTTAAVDELVLPPVAVQPVPATVDVQTTAAGLAGTQAPDSFWETTIPLTLDNETPLSGTEEIGELQTSAAETMLYRAPLVPVPVGELEALTSSSKKARRITLMDSIYRALADNQQLRVQRLSPEISNTSIQSAEGAFDQQLNAGVSHSSNRSSTLSALSRDAGSSDTRVEGTRVSSNTNANVSLSQRLPTGTEYSLSFNTNRSETNQTFPFYSSALNLNITQSLLRGAGCKVNCIQVWTAQNNFVISLYQLQQTLINLVADIQTRYWDVYLAMETLAIRRQAYEVAREQRERVEQFVRVGRSAPLDVLAAQAEESARISGIINAVADLKDSQLQFLRLLNPNCVPEGWNAHMYPAERPLIPSEPLVLDQHLRLAMYYRPDLRQAQIDLANGELEVYRSQNGLLPALDFTTGYGLTGVGDSYGESFSKIRDRENPNWNVGLQFSYPLQNRQARAAYRRANFQKRQAEEAIRNYEQIIQLDVRSAIVEIERTGRLIESTRVTARLRAEELAAEVEKYRVGRSTQLLVQQAQRDLLTAQLEEVSAVVANIRAYINLHRVEGTTLQRSGILPVHITPESGVD